MIRPAAGWGSIYEDRRDRQTRDVQSRRRIWQAERNPGLLAADIPYARRSPVLIPFPYVPRSVLYQMQENVDLFQS